MALFSLKVMPHIRERLLQRDFMCSSYLSLESSVMRGYLKEETFSRHSLSSAGGGRAFIS